MDKLISVIVPVYNVDKYLDKCLCSICNQSYNNLEIILIDDGSSDSSSALCDEYARRDDRIVVVHKCNEGVASARNEGLCIASGDYIGFVDADDYIEADMYETLVKLITDNNADISFCNYYKENGSISQARNSSSTIVEMNREEAFVDFCVMGGIAGGCNWNKLFLREVIGKNRYKRYVNGEDVEFLCRVLASNRKMVGTMVPKYHYVVRKESASRREFRLSSIDTLRANDDMLETAKREFPKQMDNMYACHASWVVSTMQILYLSKKVEKKVRESAIEALNRTIDENMEQYMKSPYVTKRDKLFIKAYHSHIYKPFHELYRFYLKLKGNLK